MPQLMTKIRPKKDYEQCLELCQKDPYIEISLWDNSYDRLKLVVKGLENTPYEGGKFVFELKVSQNYPYFPPFVHCHTPIWHPNIDSSYPPNRMNIKLVWLLDPEYLAKYNPQTKEAGWNSTKNLVDVICVLRDLIHMKRPVFKPEFALNTEARSQYLRHRKQFIDTAKSWVEKHATGDQIASVAK